MTDPKGVENLGQNIAERTEASVREIRADARELGDRVEAKLLDLIEEARVHGRHGLSHLGREIVKLGKKLEKAAGTTQRKTARRASHPE